MEILGCYWVWLLALGHREPPLFTSSFAPSRGAFTDCRLCQLCSGLVRLHFQTQMSDLWRTNGFFSQCVSPRGGAPCCPPSARGLQLREAARLGSAPDTGGHSAMMPPGVGSSLRGEEGGQPPPQELRGGAGVIAGAGERHRWPGGAAALPPAG